MPLDRELIKLFSLTPQNQAQKLVNFRLPNSELQQHPLGSHFPKKHQVQQHTDSWIAWLQLQDTWSLLIVVEELAPSPVKKDLHINIGNQVKTPDLQTTTNHLTLEYMEM